MLLLPLLLPAILSGVFVVSFEAQRGHRSLKRPLRLILIILEISRRKAIFACRCCCGLAFASCRLLLLFLSWLGLPLARAVAELPGHAVFAARIYTDQLRLVLFHFLQQTSSMVFLPCVGMRACCLFLEGGSSVRAQKKKLF
jgi:hypothetical protein